MFKHHFNRNFAVIIGINKYQNGIRELETAVPDARKLAQIIQAAGCELVYLPPYSLLPQSD